VGTDGSDLGERLQHALGPAYRVERELGGGGMSRVFVAADARLGRRVVAKVLNPELAAGLSAARFEREVTLAARLQHPHILTLLSAGDVDGLPYYTMPFIAGESLRALLRDAGPLPVRDALRLLRELADALAYAHGQRVLHRDLKPENVLLSEGHALVADLGVAKALDAATQGGGAADRGAITGTGVAVGTPAYMAPEQALGDPATDHRADLYALGVIAYELLAGAHPFPAGTPQQLVAAHVAQTPVPLARRRPEMPPALAALVDRLLAKDPTARPQSAHDVLHALERVEAPPDEHRTAVGASGGPARRARRAAAAAAAVLLVALGTLGYERWRTSRAGNPARPSPRVVLAPPRAPARQSVAVLPFENIGDDPADEAFSDGLTDELIAALGKVAGLAVTGRTSSFALKGSRLSTRVIADTLGVAALVTGSLRRAGDRLRVTAQLVTAGDSVLWTDTYDRRVEDVFAVQEETARAIAGALGGTLRVPRAGGAPDPLVRPGTADLAAYELYLRGRLFFNQRTPDGLRRAVAYFERAIARDPAYARAYAGLADTYALLMIFGGARPADALPRARAAAERAVALDGTLADGHASLGHLRFVFDWEWADALRSLDRAVALDPTYAFARQLRGICLTDLGRFDEAAAEFRGALAVDPLSAAIRMNLGQVYLFARRPDEAVPHLRDALELNPALAYAHQQLGFAYFQQRLPDDAVAAFARAAALGGAGDSAQLAYAYGVTGRRREAEAIVRDVEAQRRDRYVQPYGLVLAAVGLGDRDAAFRWLEQGYRERAAQMNVVKVLPAYEPLHGDPRWAALLRRMRLAP
jgi:serine/threonine-protein kinase